MKYLLTSSGVTNPSIECALVDLLGKPISESTALFVPTGIHPFPGGAGSAWDSIAGAASGRAAGLGWKSIGVLELTALPSIRRESWVPAVREADVLIVWGGNVLYLCHWMRESGLADLLPELTGTVYLGVSAGSIAMTPYNCDAEFNREYVPDGSEMGQDAEHALGLVDVTLYPHLDHADMPDTTLENIGRWAAGIPVPTYAIDDDTALRIVDHEVGVISEGSWKLFSP